MPRKKKEESKKIVTDSKVKKSEINTQLENSEGLFREKIFVDDTSLCQDAVLYETKNFPFMTFPFEKFNPMQSGVVSEIINTNNNFVILSPTASGKTVVFEMLASKTVYNKKKAIYLSPLKALSNEKMQDWTHDNHFFSRYKICIMTGDQEKTEAKMKELKNADIIIMTSEMLDSCRRNIKHNFDWILEVGALLIDESHLISEEGRGDKLEAAIMGFTKTNPNCQLMLSTATAPNAQQFVDWVENITKRKTFFYQSNYRPSTLTKHFLSFKNGRTDVENLRRIDIIKELLFTYSDDMFLIFCASKPFQRKLIVALNALNITCEMYNAELSYEKRTNIYNDFNSRRFRVLVSTPGLAWGVNMPARRVGIVHNKFGNVKNISTATMNQMGGRSGRPGKDPAGDAHFLVPERDLAEVMSRVVNGENIQSQMTGVIIMFHIISEIRNGEIKNIEDFKRWYSRSLNFFQSEQKMLADNRIEEIFSNLKKYGMIKSVEDSYSGEMIFEATQVGVVTSMMYLIPEDVYFWLKNFKKHFENFRTDDPSTAGDLSIARCLANIPKNATSGYFYIQEDVKEFIKNIVGISVTDTLEYMTAIYFISMNDFRMPDSIRNEVENVRQDVQRILSAMSQIDMRLGKNHTATFWKMIMIRCKYGVPKERVELCTVPHIGAALSKKLFDYGIRSIDDLYYNTHILSEINGIGPTTANKILEGLGIKSKIQQEKDNFYQSLSF